MSAIRIHVPRGRQYDESPRSSLLAELDVARLVACLEQPTATQAVKAFRETLRRP